MTPAPAPPVVARWLLRVAAGPERTSLVGDLDEEYASFALPERGPWRARFWYVLQVVRSVPVLVAHRLTRRPAGASSDRMKEHRMLTLAQDLRFSLRALRKNFAFAAVIILTLGLGIGANTILYSVVDGLILNPYPFPDGDRVIAVGTEYPRMGRSLTFIEHISPPEYIDIRDETRTLTNIVAWDMGNRQVSYGDVSENLFTGFWWGDGFQTIGMPALHGRGMTLEETIRGDAVAVLSHRIWQARFGADPELVGNTILMNGNPYTVVGIMPPGAVLYGMDLWIPMGVTPDVFPRTRRQWQVMARIAEGYALDDVETELEALSRRIELEYSEIEEYQGWHMRPLTWTAANVRTFQAAGFILMGAVGFVLLLVCSNVASLLLARSAARKQEMALRSALGAGRGRLIRQMLTESVTMALAGGVIGIVLAHYGTSAIRDIVATIPFVAGTVELSSRVLAFSLLVTVGAGILFGLVPALQNSGRDIRGTLQAEGTGTTGNVRRLRLQRMFVGVQVALALILLAGGGLLINSMLRLSRVDPGFDPEDVITMRLTLPWEQYDGPAIGSFFQTLEEQLEAIPGVEAVGRGSQFPPIAFAYQRIQVEGAETVEEGQLPVAMTTLASPGYFDALGIPLVAGRVFDDGDTEQSPIVAVVNESAARTLFGDREALGARFQPGTDPEAPVFEVVGIVGDARNNGVDQPTTPEVWANHRQMPGWSNQMFLILETEVEPYSVVPAVRAAVQSLDRDQPVYRIQTVEEALAAGTVSRRIATRVMSVFAGFALILAAVGIFSVVAFAVGERTREIGLRVALGAETRQVRYLVIRQALLPVLLGAILGLGATLALGRLMSGLLFGVSGSDPLTLTAVTGVFGLIALAASYLPSLRATRLDPVTALRSE